MNGLRVAAEQEDNKRIIRWMGGEFNATVSLFGEAEKHRGTSASDECDKARGQCCCSAVLRAYLQFRSVSWPKIELCELRTKKRKRKSYWEPQTSLLEFNIAVY